jgi:hypothetical protein
MAINFQLFVGVLKRSLVCRTFQEPFSQRESHPRSARAKRRSVSRLPGRYAPGNAGGKASDATRWTDGSVADKCKRLFRIDLTFHVPRTRGIAMNYLLRLTPSDIQIRWMAHPHSLRHPLFRRRWFADDFIITCALSLVTGTWPSWHENLASASPRARFYDGSYVSSQSSRNAGKPMSGRWAILGGWTRPISR